MRRSLRYVRLARERRARASMLVCVAALGVSLVYLLGTIALRGLPGLSWEMIATAPQKGYYAGGGGGILNAILGSLLIAGGGTLLAFFLGFPVALGVALSPMGSRLASASGLASDMLWGTPSIVYGAVAFLGMVGLGMRSSLLAGMATVALIELPMVIRGVGEAFRGVPQELREASLALGATRTETALRVYLRQAAPGAMTAGLLAFGRGIGDAAAVLFTAGYTDRLPSGLLEPAATLPLAVFFQLGTPNPEVKARAYTAALVLTLLVLGVSLGARIIARRLGKNVVR